MGHSQPLHGVEHHRQTELGKYLCLSTHQYLCLLLGSPDWPLKDATISRKYELTTRFSIISITFVGVLAKISPLLAA
ncbi:hypothetical protein VNO78_22121 [Psophocarpus tetragonolobus]|uniref:Uncharacterized protein n=1 Tax=Psophocarpus tetragonolobus TaxID=3891 RepID=A0AAN9XIW6_PSOTE